MSNSKSSRTLSLALSTAFAAGMAASNVAAAEAGNNNPFAMSELSNGYMQLADNHMGDKGREGRCGEGRGNEKQDMEGKCGSEKKAEKEGKCGEGKCGSNK